MNKKNRKIQILNSWLNKDIRDTTMLVRIGMKALDKFNKGICRKTNKEIADYLCISEKTVKRGIKELKDLGYIRKLDEKTGYELLGEFAPQFDDGKRLKDKKYAYTEINEELLESRIKYQVKILIIVIKSLENLKRSINDEEIMKRLDISEYNLKKYRKQAKLLGFIAYEEVGKRKFDYKINYKRTVNFNDLEKMDEKKKNSSAQKKQIKAPGATHIINEETHKIKIPRSTRKVKGSEDSNSKVSVRIYI